MKSFDIGNVYSFKRQGKPKQYFVAVRSKTLITCKDGKIDEYTQGKSKQHSLEHVSVGELCQAWGIEMEDLDEHLKPYFQPDPAGRK